MTKPYFETKLGKLYHGDCRTVMPSLEPVDLILTDPPYELGFMGKVWDSSGVAFQVETWEKVLAVCKPGAFLLAFGGTRAYHRLTCAIEDAGWEIRDCMMWIYGSGFPKSLDVSKAIDKAAGAEREKIPNPIAKQQPGQKGTTSHGDRNPNTMLSFPSTDAAKVWDGYGTALKPAYEPIIVAMKPLDGTFANNALTHGVAGLNIDAGRISYSDDKDLAQQLNNFKGHRSPTSHSADSTFTKGMKDHSENKVNTKGRWPANIILDEEAGAMLDEQGGTLKSGAIKPHHKNKGTERIGAFKIRDRSGESDIPSSTGGASRFFYTAKASTTERGEDNTHPTVKPMALIKYLLGLIAPPGNPVLLDPFAGSGTTLRVCEHLKLRWIGIELEEQSCKIIESRVAEPIKFKIEQTRHGKRKKEGLLF